MLHVIAKRSPFAFQKGSFCVVKGLLLLSKTNPFAVQKDSFWKPGVFVFETTCFLCGLFLLLIIHPAACSGYGEDAITSYSLAFVKMSNHSSISYEVFFHDSLPIWFVLWFLLQYHNILIIYFPVFPFYSYFFTNFAP